MCVSLALMLCRNGKKEESSLCNGGQEVQMSQGEISKRASSRLTFDRTRSRFKNKMIVIDKRFCGLL